jgi:HlyD family secretion protein
MGNATSNNPLALFIRWQTSILYSRLGLRHQPRDAFALKKAVFLCANERRAEDCPLFDVCPRRRPVGSISRSIQIRAPPNRPLDSRRESGNFGFAVGAPDWQRRFLLAEIMANKSSSRGLKWISTLVVVAAAACGAIWYFGGGSDAAPEFQAVPAARGDLMQVVTATGTLNPVTNVTVGSQISGIIQKLFADWNTPVKANQVVAQLDPATYKAAVQQAEGDLANTKANLELSQVQAKRAEELSKAKLISDSDHDTAIANLHQAEAMVQIKQASLDNAKVNLERCTIYSPVDGTVISRNVDVGQTVAASMSAPTLFVIANDLAKMQIDANVSEADIGSVEEAQLVNFTVDAFPGRTFIGNVVQIRNSPTTVQNVVTYDSVIGVSNPDLKLRPGMTANASIIVAQRTNVLKVPNAALRFKPPEPSTNKTFVAQLLAKIGLGKEANPAVTNAAPASKASSTNTAGVAANGELPLTGNEPPEELQRRVREMRQRGEDVPPEIQAKLREYYQSGVLQRPGGGGAGGGPGARGGGSGSRGSQPSSRTVYVLAPATPPGGGNPAPAPQAVRVRTGISDGTYTEITDGLKEGDHVIIAVKLPLSQTAAPAPGGTSPFGGGGGGRRGF